MKNDHSLKAGILVFLFALSLSGFAQEEQAVSGPRLTFEKPSHDYGTVYVDDLPETKLDIQFTNTGNEPLVLSNVRACCGTRVTAWSRDPVMPGEEAVISVEFRLAPRPQRIRRTVTITSNQEDSPTNIFRITGQVVERE